MEKNECRNLAHAKGRRLLWILVHIPLRRCQSLAILGGEFLNERAIDFPHLSSYLAPLRRNPEDISASIILKYRLLNKSRFNHVANCGAIKIIAAFDALAFPGATGIVLTTASRGEMSP
jgi:hypothetical protein